MHSTDCPASKKFFPSPGECTCGVAATADPVPTIISADVEDGVFIPADDNVVVSLYGADAPVPGHPDPDVVERLERLLAMAKRGEIVAIGYAYVEGNENVTTGYCAQSVVKYALFYGVSQLDYQIRHEQFEKARR